MTQKKVHRDERIVYCVVSLPGGIDGRDFSDKGGSVIDVFLERTMAEKRVDAWSTIEPRVVDFVEEGQKIMKDLSPLQKLVLREIYT